MKKQFISIFILLLLLPISVFAYSNKIIIGGETIGIEVHSNGVYIVGFYPVNHKNIGEEAGFEVGDIIKKANGKEIKNTKELNEQLEENPYIELEIERNKKNKKITLQLEKEDNIYKTGLYVKDQINGIGTLSYIDPETKIFGSLGHEILESSSFQKFEIEKGNIYKAEVSSIKKSSRGLTGEKNGIMNKQEELGTITKNEPEGIFGIYEKNMEDRQTTEIATKEEIKKGKAIMKTVIEENKVEDYEIEILSIDESSNSKNILFEITDPKLLKETGGIIQGMSGSPILQNNKIIGVVNYVIVEEAKKGYGIFITKMLEEGDKIFSE